MKQEMTSMAHVPPPVSMSVDLQLYPSGRADAKAERLTKGSKAETLPLTRQCL